MAKKLACAVFAMVVFIGIAAAEEFGALVTGVKDGKVSFYKTKKGKKDGDEVTLPTVDKVEVAKAKFDKTDKKYSAGDAIEGGLKNEKTFSKDALEKGVSVRIITDDDGKKIKSILVTGGKKAAAN
jgi:hypothetical protein